MSSSPTRVHAEVNGVQGCDSCSEQRKAQMFVVDDDDDDDVFCNCWLKGPLGIISYSVLPWLAQIWATLYLSFSMCLLPELKVWPFRARNDLGSSLGPCHSKLVQRLARATALAGRLLEMRSLRPRPRPPESDFVLTGSLVGVPALLWPSLLAHRQGNKGAGRVRDV